MHRTHIKANRPWWKINWRELVEYQDLFWLTIHRDLTSIYKQSLLGPLWFIIQPILTTVVLTVVFGNFAKISTDGLPPFLFYMSGLVLWNYFQGVLNGAASSLMSRRLNKRRGTEVARPSRVRINSPVIQAFCSTASMILK